MPQSHAQVWLHVVFSTKERQTFMRNETFRSEMFRMLAYEVKQSDCISASVGGHIDHIHLLVGLARIITIAKLVERVKTETSKWAKDANGGTANFAWQAG